MLNSTRNSISRQSDISSQSFSDEFSNSGKQKNGLSKSSTQQNHDKILSSFLHLNLLKEIIFNLKYRIERKIQDPYSEVIVLEHEVLKERKQLIDAPAGNQVTILFLSIEHFDQICLFDPKEAFQMLTDTYFFLVQKGLQKHRGYEFFREEDVHGVAFHSSFEAVQFASWLQKEILLMNYEVDQHDQTISESKIKLLQLPFLRTERNDSSTVIFRGFRIKIGVCVGDPDYRIDNALHNTVNWGDSWAGNIWHEMDPRSLKFNYYGSVVEHAKSIMKLARGGETLVTRQVWKNIKKLAYSKGFEDNIWMAHIDVEFASERETNALERHHSESDEDDAEDEEDHDMCLFIEDHMEEEYTFLHATDLRRILPEFLKSRTFSKPVSRIPVELQYERLINQYLQLKLDMRNKRESKDVPPAGPDIFRPTEFDDRILLTPLDILTQANVEFREEDPSIDKILPRTALITPELLLSSQASLKIVNSTDATLDNSPVQNKGTPREQMVLDATEAQLKGPPSPKLESSVALLEKEMKELKDANSYLRFQLSLKTRELDDLGAESRRLKERLELSVTEDILRENAELKQQNTTLDERLSAVNEQSRSRERKLVQAHKELDEKDQMIEQLKAQLDEMNEVKEYNRRLFDTVEQQHTDIKVLTAENKKLLARLRVDEILMKPETPSRGKLQQFLFSPSPRMSVQAPHGRSKGGSVT
uniref:Guanylate cyclase domain-containing protein n=1 Tax=Percolomonas cosmopolitus TaxID=63605 RepID=A0A7S1PI69_9EUKA